MHGGYFLREVAHACVVLEQPDQLQLLLLELLMSYDDLVGAWVVIEAVHRILVVVHEAVVR